MGEYPSGKRTDVELLRQTNVRRLILFLSKQYSAYEAHILRWGTVVLFLLVWEIAVNADFIPELFASSPSRIIKATVEVAREGTLWKDLLISGQELFAGFLISLVTAIPLGMLLGWYPRFRMMTSLFISFFYAMPRVAMLPLLILWLGIGIYSKIALVFLGSFFPIIISTASGIQNIDESLIDCSRSFGANEWQLFTTVALPASLPFILVGCRLGVARALIGVVVGELYGATAGVGFFIANAGSLYQTDRVFVGIIIVSVAGVLLIELMNRIESRFQRWRPESQQIK